MLGDALSFQANTDSHLNELARIRRTQAAARSKLIGDTNARGQQVEGNKSTRHHEEEEQQVNLKQEMNQTSQDSDQDYRNFDPYSVYADEDDEEDVWYSEERLFQVS